MSVSVYNYIYIQNDGPWWIIPLGRRDSTTANRSLADTNLPAPFLTLDQLKQAFANQGLNTTDLVALSGTIYLHLTRYIHFNMIFNFVYNKN